MDNFNLELFRKQFHKLTLDVLSVNSIFCCKSAFWVYEIIIYLKVLFKMSFFIEIFKCIVSTG